MKRILIIILIFFLLLNCKSSKIIRQPLEKEDITNKNKQDSLSFLLCEMYGSDQGVRLSKGFPNKMKLVQRVDSFNFDRMILFIKKNGFPRKELLGKNYNRECVKMAFFAILLHNPHRIVNEKQYFNLLLNETKEKRLSLNYFVTILDKYYWIKSHTRDVMYGSQFGKPCITHKEETNIKRAEIGLKPLLDNEFKQCK